MTAWAGGALAGLGALWVVLLNGFMLGAVFGVGTFVVAYVVAWLLLPEE